MTGGTIDSLDLYITLTGASDNDLSVSNVTVATMSCSLLWPYTTRSIMLLVTVP